MLLFSQAPDVVFRSHVFQSTPQCIELNAIDVQFIHLVHSEFKRHFDQGSVDFTIPV